LDGSSEPVAIDFAELVADVPAMVACWRSRSGEVVLRYANRAFVDFFGPPDSATLIGSSPQSAVGEGVAPYLREILSNCRAGVVQYYEREANDARGRSRWIRVAIRPQRIDGDLIDFIAISEDVTARRAAERTLAEREQQFHLAFELPSYGRATLDRSGHVTRANEAICALLGVAETAMIGRPLADFLTRPNADGTGATLAEVLDCADETHMVGECLLRRRDHASTWVAVAVTYADDRELDFGVASMRDVSSDKAFELELRAAAGRLAEAETVAGLGSWQSDLRTGQVDWTDGMYRLLGLDRGAVELNGAAIFERVVHKDDRQRLQDELATHIAQRSAGVTRFRAVRGDGRLRLMEAKIDVLTDARGEPARLVGVLRDVSDTDLAAATARAPEPAGAAEGRTGASFQLTGRQLEVLRLIAHGRSNREIAQELFISPGTVKWHVKAILAKTGASTRAEAVAKALGEE
jgi:PAS domain S-box-containing protein